MDTSIAIVCLVYTVACTAEQTFAGCHIAFLGVFAIAVVIALVIIVLVRDKKSA